MTQEFSHAQLLDGDTVILSDVSGYISAATRGGLRKFTGKIHGLSPSDALRVMGHQNTVLLLPGGIKIGVVVNGGDGSFTATGVPEIPGA